MAVGEGNQPSAPGRKGRAGRTVTVQDFRVVVGRGCGQAQTSSLCPLLFPERVSASGRSHRRPLALCIVCAESQAECNRPEQTPVSWGFTVVLGELRRGP